MKLNKQILTKLVKEEKAKLLQGTHTYGTGDIVKDINPDCPHHGAEGKVTKVGKGTITFIVTNNGKNYKEGDELEKTEDQMVKLTTEGRSKYKFVKKFDKVKDAQEYASDLGSAIVFKDKNNIPKTFMGLPVIDGDKDDLRFLDPNNQPHVIALYAKGQAKKDNTGFVINN